MEFIPQNLALQFMVLLPLGKSENFIVLVFFFVFQPWQVSLKALPSPSLNLSPLQVIWILHTSVASHIRFTGWSFDTKWRLCGACKRVKGVLWPRSCFVGFPESWKKNWVNPAFSTGGIRTHDTRIRSTVALPTKLRGLAETNRGRVCNFIVG